MAKIFLPTSHTECHADGCEWDIDWLCAKVVAYKFCGTCAQDHELVRTMRGGCVSELESEYGDLQAEHERRTEAYKKRGLI